MDAPLDSWLTPLRQKLLVLKFSSSAFLVLESGPQVVTDHVLETWVLGQGSANYYQYSKRPQFIIKIGQNCMLLFCNAQNKIEHLDLLTYIFLKDLISINGTLDGFGYNLFDAWMRSVIYVVHHFKFIPNDATCPRIQLYQTL